jgi:hypothetical protein
MVVLSLLVGTGYGSIDFTGWHWLWLNYLTRFFCVLVVQLFLLSLFGFIMLYLIKNGLLNLSLNLSDEY